MDINTVICGNCLDVLRTFPDKSVDLIFTSPPYADRRKSSYGGVSSDEYVRWFVPIAEELYRVLSDRGSFFLNIKPHTNAGERELYVFDLVLSLRRRIGFRFVDEFCWTKNAFPGKLKGRFKNAFEPVYHFSKSKDFTFNPVACATSIKPESIARAYRKQCGSPTNGSKMTGMNTTNIRHATIALPSNWIHVNNVSNQFSKKKYHPATFPVGLTDFFVQSFSSVGDVVLDPFCGSGTTLISSKKFGRFYIGIDMIDEYVLLSKERLETEVA